MIQGLKTTNRTLVRLVLRRKYRKKTYFYHLFLMIRGLGKYLVFSWTLKLFYCLLFRHPRMFFKVEVHVFVIFKLYFIEVVLMSWNEAQCHVICKLIFFFCYYLLSLSYATHCRRFFMAGLFLARCDWNYF